MKVAVSIIILTYNEEANLKACLESMHDFSEEIFVVDSFSTDRTIEIAGKHTNKIFQNHWTNYAGQRQWALANLPFTNDWVLFIDADERLTGPSKKEMAEIIDHELKSSIYGGYYIPRKFFFLGRHLKWGGGQNSLKEMRLCNRHYLTIGERAGHEIYISKKCVGSLKEAIIHEDKKPLSAWIDRHNRYSTANANYLWSLREKNRNPLKLEKDSDYYLFLKELFRRVCWNKLPIGCRPTLLFIYNYLFRLGFLDGIPGFIYIFLHDFWFNLLVDAKLIELRVKNKI